MMKEMSNMDSDSDQELDGFADSLYDLLDLDKQNNIPARQVITHQKEISGPKSQFCLTQLLPFIIPHIDQPKATHIYGLCSKLKNNQIKKQDFTSLFRNLVGVELLREAISRESQGVAPSGNKISSQTQNCASHTQFHVSELLPLILPHLDKEKAMRLQLLHLKLKKNEIQRHQFLKALREIVGDERILREAILKLQVQQKMGRQVPQNQGGILSQTPPMNIQNCDKSNPRKGPSPSPSPVTSSITRPSEWNFLRTTPKPNTPFVGQKKKRVDAPHPSLPNKKQKVATQQTSRNSLQKQAVEVEKHQNVSNEEEKATRKEEVRVVKETPANLKALSKWEHMAEEARQKRGGLMVASQTGPTTSDHPTIAKSSECVTEREPEQTNTVTLSDDEFDIEIENAFLCFST